MSVPVPFSHMAFIRARAGCSEALGVRLSELLEPSRQAPGCLQFSLQHSQGDPALWLVCGFWSDQAAMTAYFNTPAMLVFAELVQQVLVDSLDFHTFREVAQPAVRAQCPVAMQRRAS